MASSSSTSIASSSTTSKYDVFVSFRGEDTRYNFTDHLYAALQRKGIVAFRDDTKLKKGKSIAPELLQAIEGSQIYIVVFSKNYASSTWCLRELTKILDCVQVSRKYILPIFYDVDPSEVRKQNEGYEKAFGEHEERFKEDSEMMEKVKRWRIALKEIANLSGWDVRYKPQNTEIEKIVKEIITILGHNFPRLPNDIVGMQSPAEELEKLLALSSVNAVRVVGICGMGGAGKTTLATVLWDKISHQFDASCFIADVCKSDVIDTQKQILQQALNEENLHIFNPFLAADLIRRRLRYIRAFIVLDNVDQVEQLEKLGVNREWLGAGSRIIITSRDLHILRKYGVDDVYTVKLLNPDNALQLFSRKAFNCDNIGRDYKVLSYEVLEYAKGLPLAIKVLGSFLFGRDVHEWRSALARLRENPSKDIMDVLRISYDGLEEMEKEIFLDIACFFNGHKLLNVEKVLSCCEFHPYIGIGVLIDKSLLTVSSSYANFPAIKMHDLLEELGKKLVRENSPKKPRKWSRLWLYKDLFKVMLKEKMGENNVEAIVLNSPEETRRMMAEGLSKLNHLRLLILRGVKFSGSLKCLSNNLRYVDWHEYPFMYLPFSFQPEVPVHLILKHSCMTQLWEGKKYMPNLISLDLSHSKNLIKMPDFGDVPNLERLTLEGCIKLVEIDPSIGLLRKLEVLNLEDCKNLLSIPNNIVGLTSIKSLNLSGCSKVFNNQLDISSETAMHSRSASSCIFKRCFLPFRSLNYKDSTISLLPSLPSFSCLVYLKLSFCKLVQFPEAIGSLHYLKYLNLEGNKFVTLTCSLKEFSKLVDLRLSHCKKLKSLPELPSRTDIHENLRIIILYVFNCPNLEERERCSTMIFPWMAQVIEARLKPSVGMGWIDIVIPGSEIPKWFSNKSAGSSINIDPSPIMHQNNWIGIACCAVFVSRYDPITLTNKQMPRLEIRITYKADQIIPGRSYCSFNGDLVTVQSDHIWLFYFPWEQSIDFLRRVSCTNGEKGDLEDIKMEVWVRGGKGLKLEVKNCGYHWIFEKDLEQCKNMHCGELVIPHPEIKGGSLEIDD